MKRVAIPIANDRLSEHFGECSYYEIIDIDGAEIRKRTLELPSVDDITELPSWLEEQGITDVIAFRVKKQIISLFASKKVNLFVGVPQNSSDFLILQYMEGKLESDTNIISQLIG